MIPTNSRYVAMWSGPRNISTAMMRSWNSRPDHPGHRETVSTEEADWRVMANRLTSPLPIGKSVYYQKHMTHHLLPAMKLDWTDWSDIKNLIQML